MPISIKNVAQDEAIVTVRFQSEEMDVHYRPGKLTNENMKAAEAAQEAGDLEPFYKFLEEVIIKWDLMTEAGDDRLPATHQVMNKLPLQFVGTVFRQIMEDSSDLGEAPKSFKEF